MGKSPEVILVSPYTAFLLVQAKSLSTHIIQSGLVLRPRPKNRERGLVSLANFPGFTLVWTPDLPSPGQMDLGSQTNVTPLRYTNHPEAYLESEREGLK